MSVWHLLSYFSTNLKYYIINSNLCFGQTSIEFRTTTISVIMKPMRYLKNTEKLGLLSLILHHYTCSFELYINIRALILTEEATWILIKPLKTLGPPNE